jgi:hypothetical protein
MATSPAPIVTQEKSEEQQKVAKRPKLHWKHKPWTLDLI